MEVEPNGTVDIIALVKEASEAQTILTKKQTQVTKRELVLVDNSGWSVRCTLWGQQAENFSNIDRPVIALKGARVSDFGGRSISCSDTTAMSVNPDIQEAYKLKGWYETTGISLNFESFSNENSGTANGSSSKSDVKTIAQVNDLGLGFGEKPDYFSIWGTITHIRSENAFYPACANPAGCNKKAMDLGGEWRCEKCDMQFQSPMWRYILSFCVCDEGGQMWMQLFNDEAEKLLGVTANQMADLRDINNTEYTQTFERAVWTTHLFKCRAKNEVYQDEAKMRVTCLSATPVDYRARSSELLSIISEISGIAL
jgi:replication factor A1